MRKLLWVVVAAVALAGCKKTDDRRAPEAGALASSAEADALWALAPAGTKLGIVATGRAMQLAEHAWLDVHAALAQAPDLAPLAAKVDASLTALTGGPHFVFADAGLDTARGGAIFLVDKETSILVAPVGDPDKFMARIRATDAPGEHQVCRPIKGYYACADTDAMLDLLGKGDLHKQLAAAGARGDIEIVGDASPFGSPAAVAIVAQLSRGAIVVRGTVDHVSPRVTAALGAPSRPRADDTAAGFAVANVETFVADLPTTPVPGDAPDVRLADLGRSIGGPLTLTALAGELGLDLRVPLSDPGPAQKLIAHCADLGQVAGLQATLVDGACRFAIPNMSLALEARVTGKELRIAKQRTVTTTVPLTGIGAELAKTDWSAALWGRGTLFGQTGVPSMPAGQELPLAAAYAIRAMSVVNELGAAARVDGSAVHFVFSLRTVWANPDDVVAKILAIAPMDIATGKGGELAKPIAAAAPGSPFAGDYTAGYSGLLVPAALGGMLAAVAIPAFMDYVQRADTAKTAREAPAPAH